MNMIVSATTIAAAAPVASAAAADADAELIAACERYKAAYWAVDRHLSASNRVEERRIDEWQERHPAAQILPDDATLGLLPVGGSGEELKFYASFDATRFRSQLSNLPLHAIQRAVEIISAVDANRAERRAWEASDEFEAAEAENDRLSKIRDDLAELILKTRAATVEGLAAKAECVALWLIVEPDEWPGLNMDGDPSDAFALSIARDLFLNRRAVANA